MDGEEGESPNKPLDQLPAMKWPNASNSMRVVLIKQLACHQYSQIRRALYLELRFDATHPFKVIVSTLFREEGLTIAHIAKVVAQIEIDAWNNI